ncbi:MAG: ADP-ribosylglycohydrolase family protein, partial [Syntrophomonas sp.]
ASDQFLGWTRRSGGRYWSHYEKILPGEYSDDTQMILAVARSIITGNWESTLAKKELPYWLEYERGGGSAVKSAAKLLKSNVVPWESKENRKYFMAGGNGAAMRILPHVIAGSHKLDIDILISDVIKDSLYTHGHPRAILGASCYAFTLHYLMNKETVLEYGELIRAVIDGAKCWNTLNPNILPSEWLNFAQKHSGFDYLHVWSDTVSSMIEKLEFISGSLNKGLLVNDGAVLKRLECFDKVNGAGDVAILSSLYLASKYANNPVLGIKTAAYSLGADTDTIASMSGGLLGMLCGTSWIPTEWKHVQDYNCLANIAEILLANNMIEASKQITSKYKIQHNDWKDSPIGKLRFIDTSVVPSGRSGRVIIKKMETMLGQTLYFKKYERTDRTTFIENNIQEELFKTVLSQRTTEQVSFSLGPKSIQELMDNPLLARITFKKVLQIIDLLMTGNLDCTTVADKLKVNTGVVEIVKNHINKPLNVS